MRKSIVVIGEGITEKYYIESLRGLSDFQIKPRSLNKKASNLKALEKEINDNNERNEIEKKKENNENVENNKLSKIIVVDKYSHSTSLKYQYNRNIRKSMMKLT